MTVDRAAVVVLVLHRKRNINKMCENARGFCLLAFFVVGNRGEPEASRSGQDRRGGEACIGAPRIRGAKNLSLDLQKIVVTGANKRPVWLLLSGTSVYPHYLVITSSKHL